VKYQRDSVTNLAPDALKAIHPLGTSPLLRDYGQVVIQSGAIIEYIVRQYGKAQATLRPSGSEARAATAVGFS
jgi:glutathione S-transferase